MSDIPLTLRALRPSDEGFVFSRWLKSYRTSGWANSIGKPYWEEHHRLVKRLLERAEWRMAAWDSDDAVLAGFACVEPGIVHYVYVEPEARRQGIAHTLLADRLTERQEYTHRTPFKAALDKSAGLIPAQWIYNPYRLFGA